MCVGNDLFTRDLVLAVFNLQSGKNIYTASVQPKVRISTVELQSTQKRTHN